MSKNRLDKEYLKGIVKETLPTPLRLKFSVVATFVSMLAAPLQSLGCLNLHNGIVL